MDWHIGSISVGSAVFRYTCAKMLFEPRHDKTNKVSVRPAKTRISLGIRPVWSESSLSAWRKLGVLNYPLSAQRRRWSDWADSQADLSLHWAHSHFVGFVMSRLICSCHAALLVTKQTFFVFIPNINSVHIFNTVNIVIPAMSVIFNESPDTESNFSVLVTNKPPIPVIMWTTSSEFGTYRLCEQRRFRRACASAQSRQNLRCSLIQAVSQEEPSDRKPDP